MESVYERPVNLPIRYPALKQGIPRRINQLSEISAPSALPR